MARKFSPLRLWSEYLLVSSLAFTLRALPLSLAAALGRSLGMLYYAVDRRHRVGAAGRVKDAYGPSLPDAEVSRIVRAMYRHFGVMMAEFVRIPTLTAANLDRFIDWNGVDREVEGILAEGKGVIMVTGHIGNWEMAGASFALKGYSVGAVARPLDNAFLDRSVREIRESSGQQIWDKIGALRRAARVLKEGRAFGILVDQDAGKQGVFVPFFGIEASSIPTPADLALSRGCPIVTIAMQRLAPMRFIFRHGRVLRPDPSADRDLERMRLLRGINEDLEGIIRQAPEQWIWNHRRWKTRPPATAP